MRYAFGIGISRKADDKGSALVFRLTVAWIFIKRHPAHGVNASRFLFMVSAYLYSIFSEKYFEIVILKKEKRQEG
jgi:hypothetical protein